VRDTLSRSVCGGRAGCAWRASLAGARSEERALKRSYFESYCGYGPYDEDYRYHSGIDHCISIVDHFGIPVRSVLVLGAATGRVLEDFDAVWDLRPYGCELSRWAHARIPARYRRRIERADLRRYVRTLDRAGRRFDLCFSNALVYVEADEIPELLAACARIAGHFHFWSSTSEDHEAGDRWRVTTRSRKWWRRRFAQAGFEPTRSPYLWRSSLAAELASSRRLASR
jgi:hypothetical protein